MFESFADWLVFSVLSLRPESSSAQALHFFIYDSVKIIFLLILMTHLMSVVRYYLPIEKMKQFLASHNFYGLDYFFASLFGAITPFCSCSSIPLFVGFLQAGIPLGLTFTFLATSPLINEIAIVLFLSLFGWKITLFYIAAGVLVGMGSGFILSKLNLEKEVKKDLFADKKPCCCKKCCQPELVLVKISRDAFAITRRVFPFVIIGVGIGAFIHGYVPEGYFEIWLNKNKLLSVPMAVALAVPLYANASGAIPIIEALVSKGVAFGTALAFMMAMVGLSLPEAIILKRVMSWKLLGSFFMVVATGIIIIGYGFNLLL